MQTWRRTEIISRLWNTYLVQQLAWHAAFCFLSSISNQQALVKGGYIEDLNVANHMTQTFGKYESKG